MQQFAPHLRRDGDDPAKSLPSLVLRQARECLADLVRAGGATTSRQYPAVAARLLSYHASFALRPLAFSKTITMGARVNDGTLKLTLRNNTSDLHVYREIFLDRALEDIARKRLADAKVVVDLGSNIGLATAYLSRWAANATFYCAEPAAECNAVAERNAVDNAITAIIDRVAIADHDGTVEFYPNEWWASSSTVRSVVSARTARPERFESALALPPISVEAISMPMFLRRHGIEHVDLMKIDIEGAEQEVVRGDADWLDAVRTVAIEVHRKYVDPEPIMATLRRHGFRLRHDAGPLDVFTR